MKRITLMELWRNIGALLSDVHRHGMEFMVVRHSAIANKDTPIAYIVPATDELVILPSGEIIGGKPITLGEQLDATY